MRFNEILLVATVVLVARVNASSFMSQSISTSPTASDQHHVRAQWLLRNGTNMDEEERQASFGKQLTRFIKQKQAQFTETWRLFMMRLMRKSASGAFTYLKLHEADDRFLFAKHFRTWQKHMTKISEGNPDKEMVKFLKTRFDEVSLARILQRGKGDYSMASSVYKLQDELIGGWVANKFTAENVLEKLKQHKEVDEILTGHDQIIFINFMSRLHSSNPDQAKLSLDAFRLAYSDGEVAKALEIAKTSLSMKPVAEAMQNELFRQWCEKSIKPDQLRDLFKKEDQSYTIDMTIKRYEKVYNDFIKGG